LTRHFGFGNLDFLAAQFGQLQIGNGVILVMQGLSPAFMKDISREIQ